MTLTSNRLRPKVVAFAFATILIAAFAFPGSVPKAGAAQPRVTLKIVTGSLSSLAQNGKLQVKVSSDSRAVVTVGGGRGGAGGAGGLLIGQKVTFSGKGSKTVGLALTAVGRSELLATCQNRSVSVSGKFAGGKATTSKSFSKNGCVKVDVGPDPDVCDWLDPTVCLQPFANDYFTREEASSNTGRMLDISEEGTPRTIDGDALSVSRINKGDGFSPGNLITLKIPGLDTPAAVRNSGLVGLTDLSAYDDPNQAVMVIDAETGERHPIWAEIDSNPTSVDPARSCGDDEPANWATCAEPGGVDANPGNTEDVNLIIRPAANWEHGHRYIVVLRNLRNAQDRPIQSPLAYRVYRDRIGTDQAVVEDRRPHMESIIQSAIGAGVKRSDLYMAWDFTVASGESVTGNALKIRDDAFSRLGDTDLADRKIQGSSPVLNVTSVNNNPGDSRILRRIDGTIQVPCYLSSNNCDPGGVFQFDGNGELIWTEGKTATFPWRCQIPRDATAADPTTTGTYGHGLLGSYNQIGAQTEVGVRANTTWCALDWAGFSDKDLGTVLSSLYDMSNFPKLVDRMQQGFVNFMYLQRALIHPNGAATLPAFQDGNGTDPGAPLIDTSDFPNTRGQYMGISQGGIMGGALTPLSPDVDYGVLGVPGINYSTLLRRSVDSDGYFKPGGLPGSSALYVRYPDEGNRMLLLSLVQLMWDPGEGNGYANFLSQGRSLPNSSPKKVLYRVALGDHQVTNYAAEVAARTVGAAVYYPALQPGRHWDRVPFYGMRKATSFPWSEGSIMVYYDSGPETFAGTRGLGVKSPPLGNVPPRGFWGYGEDPHSMPRASEAGITHAIEFLNGPNLDGRDRGWIRDCLSITGTTGDLAPGIPPRAATDRRCYSNGWNGISTTSPVG